MFKSVIAAAMVLTSAAHAADRYALPVLPAGSEVSALYTGQTFVAASGSATIRLHLFDAATGDERSCDGCEATLDGSHRRAQMNPLAGTFGWAEVEGDVAEVHVTLKLTPSAIPTKLDPVVPAQHIELPALSGSAGIDALFLGSEGEGHLRVYLFDPVTGAPLRGTLTEVCNPCSLEVDAASRLSRLSLEEEIQAAGGLEGDVSASAAILVAGDLESVAVAPVENKGGARPLLPFADTSCP